MIKLKSVDHDAADNTVTLISTKAFALTKPIQLLIDGQPPSGLRDGSGRSIDCGHDGRAGSDAGRACGVAGPVRALAGRPSARRCPAGRFPGRTALPRCDRAMKTVGGPEEYSSKRHHLAPRSETTRLPTTRESFPR